MRSLSKNSVEVNIGRALAALAAGIVCGHICDPIAGHLGYQLAPNAGLLIGIVTAVATWFASRKVIRVLQQTEDTMRIPTVGIPVPARLHDGGLSSTGAACATKRCPDPAGKCVDCSADLKLEPQADGSVNVTITVTGLSKREFSNLRARIEDSKTVPNSKWEFPKNQGLGVRQMTGSVLPGNAQKQALAKLEELTGKRV